MKVKTAQQKVILSQLFRQADGQPVSFSVDKLADAGSALKKINESSEPVKDQPGTILFKDGDIDFTPAEVTILKTLFDEKKEWLAVEADVVLEIKALFDGK
jgi:hypothetical protein